MANTRKITKRGHTVKGALAAYLVPKLAADHALKPGELTTLLLSIPPTKRDEKQSAYQKQIPLLVDGVKSLTKDRLAKDADVEDLAELLEALGGEDLDDDDEEMEDLAPKIPGKDNDTDLMEDYPGTKLMEILGKCNIPPDELEQINALVTALGRGKGEEMEDKKGLDEFPLKKKEEGNAAPMKDVPVTKPAMDAAIAAATQNGAKLAQDRIASLFSAAEAVAPVVGKIDTLAFDSADAIYKFALDAMSVPTKDVHPSAFRPMFQRELERPTQRPALAADSAGASEDFEKRYTNIPALA